MNKHNAITPSPVWAALRGSGITCWRKCGRTSTYPYSVRIARFCGLNFPSPAKHNATVWSQDDVTHPRTPTAVVTPESFLPLAPPPHALVPTVLSPTSWQQLLLPRTGARCTSAQSVQCTAHIIRSGTAHMFLIARRVCVLFAFIIFIFIYYYYLYWFISHTHLHRASCARAHATTPVRHTLLHFRTCFLLFPSFLILTLIIIKSVCVSSTLFFFFWFFFSSDCNIYLYILFLHTHIHTQNHFVDSCTPVAVFTTI